MSNRFDQSFYDFQEYINSDHGKEYMTADTGPEVRDVLKLGSLGCVIRVLGWVSDKYLWVDEITIEKDINIDTILTWIQRYNPDEISWTEKTITFWWD